MAVICRNSWSVNEREWFLCVSYMWYSEQVLKLCKEVLMEICIPNSTLAVSWGGRNLWPYLPGGSLRCSSRLYSCGFVRSFLFNCTHLCQVILCHCDCYRQPWFITLLWSFCGLLLCFPVPCSEAAAPSHRGQPLVWAAGSGRNRGAVTAARHSRRVSGWADLPAAEFMFLGSLMFKPYAYKLLQIWYSHAGRLMMPKLSASHAPVLFIPAFNSWLQRN